MADLTVNDYKYIALYGLGYRGSLNDMEKAYYKAQLGSTSNGYNTLYKAFKATLTNLKWETETAYWKSLGSVNPYAAAYVAAMTTNPGTTVVNALNEFFAATSTIWPKLDLAYFLASHDKQSRNLNIVNPHTFTLTENGTAAFTPYVGYAVQTVATDYLATGFTATTHATKGTLNDTEMGIFVLDNNFDPAQSSMSECGGNYVQIKALETQLTTGAPTTFAFRVNRAATQRNTSGAITNAVGLYSGTRTASNLITAYKNGASTSIASGSGAAVQLDNTEWYIGKANSGAASVRQLGFFYAGKVITAAERLALYNALVLYLSQVGAYVASNATSPPYAAGPDPYAPDSSYVWSEANQGTPLDLTGFTLVKNYTFASTSEIAQSGINAVSEWYAPTRSWAYTNGQFAPATDTTAFSIDGSGKLRMRMRHDGSNWRGVHMQTADTDGDGFSQTKGYWEARMKTPAYGTYGAWPAFWLYGTGLYNNTSLTRPEIDIVELYPGNDTYGHHCAVHLRPGSPYVSGRVSQHWQKSNYQRYTGLINDGNWHTFGGMVTDTYITIFFDGLEVCRMPTHPDFIQPLHILVSLQHLLAENGSMNTSVPVDQWIDYVKVYSAP